MKRFIGVVAVIVTLMSCTTHYVQTEPYRGHRQSFYYYPSANVYYDQGRSCYIYNDGRSWVTAAILPRNIYVDNNRRYEVYHEGPEVWRDNRHHRETYRGR